MHLLELADGGGAGLLEVDVGAALRDDLLEEAGVVAGAPGDQAQPLACGGRHVVEARVETDTVL